MTETSAVAVSRRIAGVVLSLSLAARSSVAATCTFADGAWDVVPSDAADEIVVASGDLVWTAAMPRTVAGWTQPSDYAGTVTFETGLEAFVVTGDVDLQGGTWTHPANPSFKTDDAAATDGRGVSQLIVRVGGNFTLGAGAQIDVTGKGYRTSQGPGRGVDVSGKVTNYVGASHGGIGMRISVGYSGLENGYGLPCYGRIKRPVTLGSGAYATSGGGAVSLEVAHHATLAGSILANGETLSGSTWGSGAGGSILVVAETLEQTGTIAADAGSVGNCSAGGGGRIALVVTGPAATLDATMPDRISAFGGRCTGSFASGHAGTIYFEKTADQGRGELLVKNRSGDAKFSADYGYGAEILAVADSAETDFSQLTLREKAGVTVREGGVLSFDTLVSDGDTTMKRIYLIGGTLKYSGETLTNPYVNLCACLKDPVLSGTNIQHAASVIRVGNGEGTLLLSPNGQATFDAPLLVEGDVRVPDQAVMTHTKRATVVGWKLTSAFPRVDLEVTGDLTVDAGGRISTDACGYAEKNGPGAPLYVEQIGGTHGGEGAFDKDADFETKQRAPCYGSVREPTDYGSGANSYQAGGGAIRLAIRGILTVDGDIGAQGGAIHSNTEPGARGGAGGSVWVTAATLAGSGTIQANGGYTHHYYNACGGGGRVAVTLTDPAADFAAFTAAGGKITAYGGVAKNVAHRNRAGAGTVYLRTGAQGPKAGTLVIDNDDSTVQFGRTVIGSDVLATEVGDVVLRGHAVLQIQDGATLTAWGSWRTDVGACLVSETGSAVVFRGAKGEYATIEGENAFSDVSFLAPGKTFAFGSAGSLFTVLSGGSLTVRGEGADKVVFRSTEEGNAWPMNFVGGAIADVDGVDVRDSNNTGSTVLALHSLGAEANNVGWNIVGDVVVGENFWNGTADTSWETADNWSLGRAPVDGDTVIVTNLTTAAYPVLSSSFAGTAVEVRAGAELTVDGALTLTESLTLSGTLRGRGTVTLDGAAADFSDGAVRLEGGALVLVVPTSATVNLAQSVVNALTVTLTGGTVTFPAGLKATVFAATGRGAMYLGAGAALSAVEVRIDGLFEDAPALTLASTMEGESWLLKAQNLARVNGVRVGDSTATVLPVYATASVSTGNVVNWNFAGAQRVWTGAAGTADFGTAENWSGLQVPGADDSVVIPTDAAPVLTTAVTVRDLYLEGGALKVDAPLTVANTVDVGAGSVLTLDVPTTVGNVCVFRAGATLTHAANTSVALTAGVTNRIDLSVGGDLVVDAGALVDLYGLGFPTRQGPGGPSSIGAGASYGGRGPDAKAPDQVRACYGSIRQPVSLGSGAGQAGGGAAKLSVGGDFRLDGEICAEGVSVNSDNSYMGQYGGSGGSIWITCRTLIGCGKVCADGARGTGAWHGAGGRVAIWQTAAADLSAFEGQISAYGGFTDSEKSRDASCGTLFYHFATDSESGGLLVVDNAEGKHADSAQALYPSQPAKTDFPAPDDDPAAFKDVSVVVRRGGALNLTKSLAVADLDVQASGTMPVVRLNGHTLSVESSEHRRGRRWGYPLDVCVLDGDAEGGAIVWKTFGLLLIFK